MTKDEYEYIERLLKKYRQNKAEVELISVMGYDYSSIKVQTSNISTLDSSVIKIDKLRKEMATIDALINVLSAKDKFIIESFYKEGRKLMWIGSHPNVMIDTENGVGMAKKEAIKKMARIYNRSAKYFESMEG